MSSVPLPLDPADEPALRLSDRERDAVADFLRHHANEGRLTLTELEDRLGQVYAAKIRSDLDGVAEGLPVRVPTSRPPAPVPMPKPRPSGARQQRPVRRSNGFPEHLRVYLVFCVFFTLIWLFSGGGYFWPIWPILGWGVGVASHGASSRPRS